MKSYAATNFGVSGSEWASCTASLPVGYAAQGGTSCIAFNNGGVNTNLTNCTFTRNRIDLANQVGAGAGFAGSLDTDRFVTGGPTTEPEVE